MRTREQRVGTAAPRTKRRIAAAAQPRGSLTVEWPTPGTTSRFAPGIRAATRADHSGGVRRSSAPWRISVGTVGYGGAGTAAGARGTSGQRRHRLISSSTTTAGSNGANAPAGAAAIRCCVTAGRWSIGVPGSHGSGVVSQTVA